MKFVIIFKIEKLRGKKICSNFQKRYTFSGSEVKILPSLQLQGPFGPIIATIGKGPASRGCWRAVKKGLVFETPVTIVPPRPKQVFLKHPRNRSGTSLSPVLKSGFLIFCASGVSEHQWAQSWLIGTQ